MAPTLPSLNPARLRSYVFRLPLFTRLVLLFIAVFWVVELQSAWDVVQWGSLVPKQVGLGTSRSPHSQYSKECLIANGIRW